MAHQYRRLFPRVLDDPKYRALDDLAGRLFWHVVGRANRIGLFKFSVAEAAEDLNRPVEAVAAAFDRVTATFEWAYDRPARVLWIPTWWRWNPPSGPGHLQSCLRDLDGLPATGLREEWEGRLSDLPADWEAGARRLLRGDPFDPPGTRKKGPRKSTRGSTPPSTPTSTPTSTLGVDPGVQGPVDPSHTPGYARARGSDPDPDPDPSTTYVASSIDSGTPSNGVHASASGGRARVVSPAGTPVAAPRALPERAGSEAHLHPNCHPPCIRVCISEKQHRLLCARHGGLNPGPKLDAFYAEVRARLPDDQPIGDRPWEFWERQFAARFASSPVPLASVRMHPQTEAVMKSTLARWQRQREARQKGGRS